MGHVAQLVARLLCKQEVVGSKPTVSRNILFVILHNITNKKPINTRIKN